MKYIVELNHPKHYYQFKYVIRNIQNAGHDVFVIARDKDVLLNILKEESIVFEIFGKHNKSMLYKIWGTFSIIMQYRRIIKRFNPDVIISKASFYGSFTAKIMGKKSIIFPDSEVVAVTNKFVVPLCDQVVTPETFGLNYGIKHIKVLGFFENCYLAPSVFTPKEEIVAQFGLKKPYAIFRFVGWHASHDVKNSGFTLDQKIELVKAVERNMTVYISSEKKLPSELEPYKLPVPSSLIHSVLYYADLYLGDSQTMATEAALLGTPAIRSNSFVGQNDMTNFIILENKYELLKNVAKFDDVLKLVSEFSKNSQKKKWLEKQRQYNQTVSDCNQVITDIILDL